MNNVRATVNYHVKGIVETLLGSLGFTFWTGDEDDPTIVPPAVGLRWIDGERPGHRSESRIRLAQLEVFVSDQDTYTAELACEKLLEGLRIRRGTPIGTLHLKDFSGPVPIDTGYTVMISPTPEGWLAMPNVPNQQARLYVYTFEVDYDPR
jgi:hypothetical protein